MAFRKSAGRPPLSTRIDQKSDATIRRMYLTGALMSEIGRAIGAEEIEVYRYIGRRREGWLRDSEFERRAEANGNIVVWKTSARETGGCILRPITLPGTTIQRNMLAEARS